LLEPALYLFYRPARSLTGFHPAFAQVGGDRVTSFLSNSLSYAQGLGIFGAGFLVIWAVANIARERPSGKQWAGAGGALLLSSMLQLLRTFAG
jgi:hypothetical protein